MRPIKPPHDFLYHLILLSVVTCCGVVEFHCYQCSHPIVSLPRPWHGKENQVMHFRFVIAGMDVVITMNFGETLR